MRAILRARRRLQDPVHPETANKRAVGLANQTRSARKAWMIT